MSAGPGGAWPVEWRARRRYLPWRARARPNGTTGKVPHGRVAGLLRPVDPLQPSSWQSWEEAWAAVTTGQADGVGLALTPGLGLTVIDLDACVVAGRLDARAARVVAAFPGAYTEFSPSDAGLHVVVRGRCPPGWRRQLGVEVLDHGFVTVTGRPWTRSPSSLPDHARQVREWHAAWAPLSSPPSPPTPASPVPEDAELLRRARSARNGQRFEALWAGRLANCASPSEADLQLLLLLLYWGGPGLTDERLDALFRQSGRSRAKWATTPAPSPYALRTLAAARAIDARRR